MTKLTETQTIILTRAATRPGNLAMPLPEGLHGAAAKMAVTRMITNGWLEEVEANLRRGEPMWRETGDGHLSRSTGQSLGQRQGDVVGALGPGAEDDGRGFRQFGHGVPL